MFVDISFGSLMDIDKLIQWRCADQNEGCFGSLMDIDKLILILLLVGRNTCFGSLMDIDKLILVYFDARYFPVLVL